jgi:hypothetical protein
MTDKIADDDFVRLPEGHVLRECDFERDFHGLRRLNLYPDLHNMIGTKVKRADLAFYCLRSDYPQQQRVLHEMALSDKAGMSFCWVWPDQASRHEQCGWVATGRTREVTPLDGGE